MRLPGYSQEVIPFFVLKNSLLYFIYLRKYSSKDGAANIKNCDMIIPGGDRDVHSKKGLSAFPVSFPRPEKGLAIAERIRI